MAPIPATVWKSGLALVLAAPLVLSACAHRTRGIPRYAMADTVPSAPPSVAPTVQEQEEDARVLQSRVTRVTVYSDRARVTRSSTVKVPSEPTVFVFRGLPGWVDDGTVQVSSTAGHIVDVRVDRTFLASSTDETWTRLEQEHKALTSQLTSLQDELSVLDAQKAQIESIKAFSLAKITQDTTLGNVSVQSYAEVTAWITDSLRSNTEARRAVQRKIEDLNPQIQASQRRLDNARALMQLEETNVRVTLSNRPTSGSGGTDSGNATLDLTYMLPGVTWEPMHELRASTTNSRVEVTSWAAVTQTSGEDWGGADLSFSTQSSTQSVRIPELEALTLGDTATAKRLLTSQVSSFTRAQSAFQGQSQLWNEVHQVNSAERARSSFEQVYKSNMEYLQVVQGRTVKLFESLERRGTTVHFKAESAQSIRGDGHPVRLKIGKATLDATQKIVAAPEQSLNAARTLSMVNATEQPFLPGKVSLYLDGAFIGLTESDFVAKGETFSLFLNVADQVKLSRELDRKQSSLVRRSRNLMQVAFIVSVENLGDTPTALTLADRIPVSENKEIRVSQVTISPTARPDSQGLLHWDLELKPKEKREFRISYQIEYPPELYIDTNRRYAPAPSAAAPRYDFEEEAAPSVEQQIKSLEYQLQ